MENKNSEEVVYSLIVEDVQTVAQQEIERELTEEEIGKVKDLIAEQINWYDAIANAIGYLLSLKETHM